MINIAIFASGAGSNAAVIIDSLHSYILSTKAQVSLIVTNNLNAGVIAIAKNHQINVQFLDLKGKNEDEAASLYLNICKQSQIDFIVLAGYLKKIPLQLIQQYPNKILNIHPALLPAYGGAGMYGNKVHQAVINANEKQSGITIHFVDEVYDHGKIIFQAACQIDNKDTAESLAQKIHILEHQHYTKVIADTIVSQNNVK
jgi:phosphoribosylglycinamide formyltransferase 1